MNLVNDLKNDHVELLKTLVQMEDSGIFNDNAVDLLITSKNLLEKHLHREDNDLYPLLMKKHADSTDTLHTIQGFIDEMNDATTSIEKFFAKYETHDHQNSEFRLDYLKVLALLTKRIEREESILFPLCYDI